MNPASLLASANSQTAWIEEHLRDLVLAESPSEDRDAVNAASALVEGWAVALGAVSNRNKGNDFGDIVELSFGTGPASLLVLGHLDTVWPKKTLESMPWKVENGRFWGPGVLDMKAGVVMALAASTLLKTSRLAHSFKLLLNSEEEVGSPVSRAFTEHLALGSKAVLVLEPAQSLAYKTSRKGVGHYVIEVRGVASHSGVDFEHGHSAIRELARVIQTTSNFTDPGKNRTVNCGVISGGTRSNVVAEYARCEVDVRVASAADARIVDALFRSLKPLNPHCLLTLTGGINRPPMERSEGTVRLFKMAQDLAAEMGFELDEAATGGGSDGNFTAALGIPTLDGMGAVGAGAHAAHEHVVIEHIAPRTALLAAMIASLS